MQSDAQLAPTADEVADLVRRLVRSEWPTSEQERPGWFREHGIEMREARRELGLVGVDHYLGKGPERWGDVICGWHTREGELIALTWFLWRGQPIEVVRAAAQRLGSQIRTFAGEPLEASSPGDDPDPFSAGWEVDGCTVDLYLHGDTVLEGTSVEGPVVQLELDHSARSHGSKVATR